MKIAVGCDPNATEFKKELIPFIEGLGHEVTDFGSDDPIYANVAIEVAEAVAAKKYDRGVLFCGTGIGVMLAANKVKGAYAAVVGDVYSAQRACLSNNCNIITLGSQVTGIKKAEVMIEAYLSQTYVYNERSGKKVDRILEYEREH
ncbi:MAG TPA: RpiB/LacA/LacB family sugar-phosphate isomerase [Candidatus Choladousia intestinipullorum]|nr:RpiB/LacA/LacB family sugar-phosphate isomerase [Candidatus Choladousia intestinipullorum]